MSILYQKTMSEKVVKMREYFVQEISIVRKSEYFVQKILYEKCGTKCVSISTHTIIG